MDYAIQAGVAWFLGFFPLAEIYVALPAALASGLDDVSAVFWTVFGNFTPVVLIAFGYERLMRWPRVARFLERLQGEKIKRRMTRYGLWFVLILTPYTGVWAMSAVAKALGMPTSRLLIASFVSVFLTALGILAAIRWGLAML